MIFLISQVTMKSFKENIMLLNHLPARRVDEIQASDVVKR